MMSICIDVKKRLVPREPARNASHGDAGGPNIIFEDSEILVIDKPAGLVVNSSRTVKERTLEDWIKTNGRNWLKQWKNDFSSETQKFLLNLGLVHRLDKETSGLMVIAKTPAAFLNLNEQFKKREIRKSYLSLVHGRFNQERKTANAAIGRSPKNRRRFEVSGKGKPAISRFEILSYWQNPKEKNKAKKYFTFLRVFPETGRTHQIRVHLSSLYYPIVSDRLYAGHKTSRRDIAWCPRLFLHSETIELKHPLIEKIMKFSLPLPLDLKTALEKRERIL